MDTNDFSKDLNNNEQGAGANESAQGGSTQNSESNFGTSAQTNTGASTGVNPDGTYSYSYNNQSSGYQGTQNTQSSTYQNTQNAQNTQSTQGTAANNYGYAGYYQDNAEPPKRGPKKKKEHKPSKPVALTRRSLVIGLIICILVSAVVGAGAYAIAISTFGGTSIDKSVTTTNYNLSEATGSELSIQEIVAKNENSVVAIETESVSTDSWLGQYVTQGAGSGVIYSEDGYIITNNHVIEGASSITVTLNDGTECEAELVATDSQTDVAVIKIDKTGLTPVTFSDMKGLCVGDLAIAIGNPLGTLSGTATEGIISALEREITLDGKQMTLIQTSASINPGNSGGGLFDQYGNLIGLVVAKSSGSDVEGLGFAIPADKVKDVAEALMKDGYVADRAAAGISVVDLTDSSKAMQYGVSLTGVYIQEVTGKNAKKAGLEAGDLIYYIDDVKVTSSAVLIKEIQDHEIGDTVTFTIVRDGDILKYDVKLQAASKTSGTDSQSSTSDDSSNSSQGSESDNLFDSGSIFDFFGFN